MELAPGTRIGPYQIVGSLGAGGMGEVYRARDTRLDRDVAIKVLPSVFAADPDRAMRFEREAKTLAALNHPHIAQIHGLEASGGVQSLVMELVEGEDLAARIARGPIPLDEAIPIARQIAEALEAAHEAGIIHRDLKPANIKLRPDGTVKVLDFGLAKALASPAMAVDAAQSPTFTSPAYANATHRGVILGTAAYMAPEQARGKPVDRRADIWAFGCVLYEMLTGQSAFAGDTVTDTLAAIVTRTPEFARLPPATPAPVRHLLSRCLERDPRLRLRDIGEARIVLARDGDAAPAVAADAPRASRGRTLAWAGGALLLAVATGVAVWQLRAPADPPTRHFTIPTPNDAPPASTAIAPDASAIAFVADERLWLQRFDAFKPEEVTGASGANAVFWSPDSAFLGFQARDQLWKVPVTGGPPIAMGRVPQNFTPAGGAAWLDDGRILFTTGGTGVMQIPAEGGTATPVIEVDPETEEDLHNVSALPGGRGLLFVRHSKDSTPWVLEAYSFADGKRRRLHEGPAFGPVYAPSGHILFEQAGGLWVLPFDLERLEATGPATQRYTNAGWPSIARDGTLVMRPTGIEGSDLRLGWVDRSGKPGALIGQSNAPIFSPRLSPDGRFVAAAVGDKPTASIWIYDIARGTERTLTLEAGYNTYPEWTPDGRHVVYPCNTSVCARRADGTGERVEVVTKISPDDGIAIAPDGRQLVFARENGETGVDLMVVDLGDAGVTAPATAPARPLITAPRAQFDPDFSPDGRFIAYTSTEAGTMAVYVSPFPRADSKWLVSRGYGVRPRWSRSGNRLYYLDDLRRIVEVEVRLKPTFEPGAILARIPAGIGSFGFDVDKNEHFLIPRATGTQTRQGSLLVIQNWQ